MLLLLLCEQVLLYNWPCVIEDGPYKHYTGHASHVSNGDRSLACPSLLCVCVCVRSGVQCAGLWMILECSPPEGETEQFSNGDALLMLK